LHHTCTQEQHYDIEEVVASVGEVPFEERVKAYMAWFRENEKGLPPLREACPECLLSFTRATRQLELRLRLNPAALRRSKEDRGSGGA
jgi:hypothetical protein